jgi:PDZ domain-containing protein
LEAAGLRRRTPASRCSRAKIFQLRRFRLNISGKHILVAMRIDDSSPRACMVDNGFNADVITESAARAVGLPVHAMGGKTPNAEGFGKGSGPETFVVDKTVTLGIKDFPILTGQTYVLDLAGFEDGMGVHFDCVLGLPLFVQYVVEIDYTKRLLTLYDPRSFEYGGRGHAVAMQVAVPPTIEAGVLTPDGRTVKATLALDLGSDAIFDFQPSFQSEHRIMQAGQDEVPADVIGLAGIFHMSIVRLPSVDFAGYKLEKPLVAFMHTPPGPSLTANDGFVGNALLRRFTVTFDYSRERVIIEPNSSFGDPFKGNMTGVKVDPESDPRRGFEVVYVEGRSVGAKAGVQEGDRIVEVNGVLCSTLLFESFREMLTAEGTPFVFEVERGGQKLEIGFRTPRLP